MFTLFQSFSEFVLQDLFLELRCFTTVLVQRDEQRIKENKKKETKPFCTLVVARLSTSDSWRPHPPGIFNKALTSLPPPPGASDSPFPSPEQDPKRPPSEPPINLVTCFAVALPY